MEFRTQHIKSHLSKENYFKLIWISIVLSIVIYLILNKPYSNYFFWFVVLVELVGFYFIKNAHTKLGSLTLTDSGLSYPSGSTQSIIRWQDVNGLEINRGSNHHKYDYVTIDKNVHNYISFRKDGQNYKLEFLIESGQANLDFEQWLDSLRQTGKTFSYKSV